MPRLFKKLFDIEREELTRALIMFLYGFLLLSAYLILKPVRNSLFLSKFGADQLIFMYMIIALAATPIAWLYGWTAARTTLPRLVGGTTLFLVVNMAVFWWLIQQQYDWLVYVFYVWVSLFGVFTTSQYWLLANYVFDAREAKRLFPFIGAGAIAGGIMGSFLTSQLAQLVGTENLLWLCVGFMLACFGLLLMAWRRRQGDDPSKAKRKKKSQDVSGMLPIILKSRHLKLLALMIALTVIVSTFVDFQFNKVVADSFDSKDELTAFFGWFFMALSIISLVLQLLFSSRILRRFGVGAAILFLPIGLLLGSAAIFLWPVLMSAVVIKISDGAFRYSINKTGVELLYLPVSVSIKERVKAFMDVVGDRLARGLGGALLYLVNDMLSWPVQWISFLSAAMISAWVAVAIMLRKEYSRTFRETLVSRTIDAEEIRVQLHDGTSIDAVALALGSHDHRQVLFALELLKDEKDKRLSEPLANLLTHKSPDVRRRALSRILALEDGDLMAKVEPLIKDPDAEVRANAMRYICKHSPEDSIERLKSYLASDDPKLVAAAARCALQHSAEVGSEPILTIDHLKRLLELEGDEVVQARAQLARALRYVDPDDPIADLCSRFLTDDDPTVRRAGLESAAHLRRREFIPTIIGYLGTPVLRGQAATTLLAYGPAILGTLRDAMLDPKLASPVRLRIPKVISQMDTAEAAEVLFAQVGIEDALLRHVVIKGLNRMRRRMGKLPIDPVRIRRLFQSEAESYYRVLNYEASLQAEPGEHPAESFLMRALHDSRNRHLEQAFRLAGLIHTLNDMVFAYRGAVSRTRILRARAIEFLDTVWDQQEKQHLFPILERQDNLVALGRSAFHLARLTRSEAVGELLLGADLWLAACAANLVAAYNMHEHSETVSNLARSPHAILRETARDAWKQLRQEDTGDQG
jgi:ATP/ADP translocase/HEAT repeat protein